MNPFISPNWHVILIHYPLGLVSIGLLIELGSFLWKRSSVRAAGRWMLLIGILACVPSATSGLFAFRQVVNGKLDLNQTWPQVKADAAASASGTSLADEGTPKVTTMWHAGQWQHMREHILWESVGTGMLVLAMLVYMGASDVWRHRLYFPSLLLLLVGALTISTAAWHAGEAVYQYGTAVRGPHATKFELSGLTGLQTRLQLHVLSAGWVLALGLAALAASIRAINEGPALVSDDAFFDTGTRIIDGDTAIDSHGNPVAPVEIDPLTERPIVRSATGVLYDPIPSSRWWLLTALLAVGTVAGGLWVVGIWDWPHLRKMLEKENRNLWHSILGSSILVLALILALMTRVARRNKWVLGFFSLLILIAMAGQVWMGVLLLYDSPNGPQPQLWKWNPAVVETVAR